MARQKWTKERVLDEIRELNNSKRRINSDFVQKEYNKLYQAACRYYGNWNSTLVEAGFSPQEIKRKGGRTIWTREKIISRIIEIYHAHGRVNTYFVQTHGDGAMYGGAMREFGSFQAAVEAAGLQYAKVCKSKPGIPWSIDRVIQEIRHRYEAGEPINSYAVRNLCLRKVTRRYFGKDSWSKALTVAGFDPFEINRLVVWNKTKVIAEIQGLDLLGLPLNPRFIKKNRYDLFLAAIKRWGSWKRAVETAGFNYKEIRLVRRNYWSKRKVIAEIRKLEKGGVRLNMTDVRKIRQDLLATGMLLFGSWGQAVEAAGFNYLEHCKVWSTKAWLRKLSKADVVKLSQRADVLTQLRKQHERKRK
jgi:hypothetical protein